VGEDDKHQRHNLFNMFLVVKDCRVHIIIDGGSCNNLVNVEVVTQPWIPEPNFTKIDALAIYGVRFGRSIYGWN
jgi:hypothetical protein